MILDAHVTPKTVQAIYAHYEAKRESGHRPHMGGSQIGRECERALWYQFRHVGAEPMEGRILRLFETGNREEARLIANLRAIGVTVWDRDPDTGKQITYTALGGHFALSLDGIGEGFAESSVPHNLEFKTMNDRNFKAILKDGLEKSNPVYWAQCHIGMHLAELDRCAFIAVNKNTDEIYMERITYDPALAIRLLAKAERIIFTDKPPAKISADPAFFGCKWCEFANNCHNARPPEVNCRTCAHATPEPDGTWSCAAGQAFGVVCAEHLFNYHAMGWEMRDAGDDWIEYMTNDGEILRNGGGNSHDLRNAWTPF